MRRAGGHEVLGLEFADDLVHASVVVAMVVREDDDVQHGDTFALQELGRTVQLQPYNYQARIELANLLIVGHDLQQAQEQTDFLLKAQPSDPTVHSVFSSLLAAQGNVRGAIEEMQKTIALDPGRWESHLSLALLQIRNNEPNAAEASLQKVIDLNPTAPQARILLGSY